MRVFVVRPFGTKTDSAGKAIDFDRTHRELIAPALSELGWSGDTTVEIIDSGNIRDDMFRLLVEADVVICDITIHNANVFYELGIRHALRKRATFLVRGGPVSDKDVFDLLTDRYLWYPVDDPGSKREELIKGLKATALSERSTDSPVFALVPELDEANFLEIQVVPESLREEIQRATAAASPGWLRLLADDVHGMRFELAAQRLIGKAQWTLKDYGGSLDTWTRVLDVYPNDIEANLAVSNLHERMSRRTRSQEALLLSDQALERVLSHDDLSTAARAEALALRGRNLKTRFLWELEDTPDADVPARRTIAMGTLLRRSLEAYMEAFRCELNAYYPGVVAFQLATLVADLAQDAEWPEHFDTDDDAEDYAEEVVEWLAQLRGGVALALDAASKDDPWAASSRADFLFLTQDNDRRIARAYTRSITNPFQHDSVVRQLELFASLGVKQDVANKVIAALGDPDEAPRRPTTHLVVFAGHMTDGPDRTPPRLPATAVAALPSRILPLLNEITADAERVIGMASACPGADLAFHACLRDEGIEGIVCLPVPHESFAGTIFGDDDASQREYLDLRREAESEGNVRLRFLELSDHPSGLPRWLRGTDRDPWERGNRWVLRVAEAWDADKVSLIAVYDGQPAASPGGTGFAVELARRSSKVEVHILPPVVG